MSSVLSFQTFMNFFLLMNAKEDILKNVGNQTVDFYILFSNAMEVNGYRQLFDLTWGWVNVPERTAKNLNQIYKKL